MSQRYPTSARVFLGNIDNAVVTKSLLRRVFSQYGEIKEDIRIHKGYAFVQYGNEKDAQAAVQGENYKQLGSKRIEAEIAKGERRNGRSSPSGARRRRGRSADRMGDSDRKRQRTDGDVFPMQQPMMMGNMPPMLGGSLGAANTILQGGGMMRPPNVPVYIMSGDLTNYANHVSQLLINAGINTYVQHINENMLLELMGQNRFGINSERFSIFLKKKNELEQSVAFRAFAPDGSTPGFADTPIQDVIQFINMNRDAPQGLMQQGGSIPPPQPPLDLGGFQPQSQPQQPPQPQPQPPSQQQQPQSQQPFGFNLQNLQQELLKFQQPQFRQMGNASVGQSMNGNPPPPPMQTSFSQYAPSSNVPAPQYDSGYNPEQPAAPRRPSPSKPSKRQQKREQQQQRREKQRHQQKVAPQQPLPASTPSTDLLSTISQLQSMISSGVGGAANTAALQNTLSTLLKTLQQQQQQPLSQQETQSEQQPSQEPENHQSTSNGVERDAESLPLATNGDKSQPKVVPENASYSKPSETAPTSDTIAAMASGGGDISNILASLQNIIGNQSATAPEESHKQDE